MSHWNLSPALVSLAGLGYCEPNWSKAWARRRAFPHFSDPGSTRPGRLLLTLPGEVTGRTVWRYERETSQKVLFFLFPQQFVLQKPGWRGIPTLWDGNSHHFAGPSGGDESEGGRELRFWVGQFLAWPGVFGNHLLLKKEANKKGESRRWGGKKQKHRGLFAEPMPLCIQTDLYPL